MHSLWFNIGVADLEKSAAFFTAIGFEQDSHMPQAMRRVTLPDGSYIMLFPHEALEQFLPVPYENTRTEVLISIGVETRDEVAEVIARVEEAGGTVTAPPMEFNGMFGAGFTDLDGHHFNLLVIPKG
ncbi:VOC family protein [Schaalia suimastitidis]|uniref:VOC family protein n=1 Tax=Schaalia suimastitidis TaxID=121163 RepID=UPI0004275724|nr:VOC family protein [Schaalia suimastitidis]